MQFKEVDYMYLPLSSGSGTALAAVAQWEHRLPHQDAVVSMLGARTERTQPAPFAVVVPLASRPVASLNMTTILLS